MAVPSARPQLEGPILTEATPQPLPNAPGRPGLTPAPTPEGPLLDYNNMPDHP
ncbi:MAG: hypothetical protein FWD25_01125 [Clostridia bacterium]|nr:hypothetical protein [Clostridia bacterium]